MDVSITQTGIQISSVIQNARKINFNLHNFDSLQSLDIVPEIPIAGREALQ